MSSLPKPVLRGHIKRRGIKTLIGAAVFAAINSALYKFLVAVPRQRAYDEFLQTYDGKAHYKNLKAWGYITPNEVYH